MEAAVLRDPWMRSRERLRSEIFQDSDDISRVVAGEIAALTRQREQEGRKCVLGLATGSTPMHVYRELVRMHREEGLSFKHVVTFNLDEYLGMQPDALQSYHRFMHEHLFSHVDIPAEAVHIPNGMVPLADVPNHCQEYERQIREAGGIDLQIRFCARAHPCEAFAVICHAMPCHAMPCHAMPCHAMQRYPLRLPACPALILGLGRTGHIGFNEKGSSRASATRLITLDRVTRVDAASDFFGESNVPRRAITMGVATILASRRIILMAFGENKAAIVRQAVEGPVSEQVAASYLQEHPDAVAFLDYAAAAGLTRVQCPWVLGPIQWTDTQVKKAVVWLAQQVGKPLLKLTDDDYNEHSLQDLLAEQGPSYDINLRVFYDLQRTITGWPGGKPPGMKGRGRNAAQHKRHSGAAHAGTEAGVAGSAAAAGSCKAAGQGGLGAARGSSSGQEGEIKAHREDDSESSASFGGSGDGAEAADGPPPPCIQLRRQYTDQGDSMAAATPKSSVFPKRILVMSPHPDDDVISMGGTLIRLIDQGHEVHVAYQTSGEIAVWDADAVRFADFAVQFGAAMGLSDNERTSAIARQIESALHNKQPGEVDSPEVLRIKSLIRRCEARSAGRTCGADVRNLHFLDMPFYSTGKVVKDPLSQRDIDIIVDLFDGLRPHQIYAAGDLSDPHGTHRTCLQAIFEALDAVRHRDWYTACSTEVYLYRGAWQEWEPWEADMVVPLSPGELQQKVDAIFKHQSQKDRALFPGADPREFWQRSQDRNRATAALFDRLGLAEYEAMEAFVRYDPGAPSSLFKTPCADSRREKAALKGGELRLL